MGECAEEEARQVARAGCGEERKEWSDLWQQRQHVWQWKEEHL